MSAVSDIHIYSEPRCRNVDFGLVQRHVEAMLPSARVSLRGPLFEEHAAQSLEKAARVAEALAGAKVRRLESPAARFQNSLPGEVEYELRRLRNLRSTVYGLLYDAPAMLDLMRGLLPRDECRRQQVLHVIFTNQLIGNWDSSDRRYHARTIICSSPSVISLSGLVEAPARDRGYYLARRGSEALGLQEEAKSEVARSFAGDYLTYEDGRMSEVVQGYVMQAVSYRLTGEPFCDDPACRLFNAHWQRELLGAQLGRDRGGKRDEEELAEGSAHASSRYCDRHSRLFRKGDVREGSWI